MADKVTTIKLSDSSQRLLKGLQRKYTDKAGFKPSITQLLQQAIKQMASLEGIR